MLPKLPWIIRKAVDFDFWFNKTIFGWNNTRNMEWLLRGAKRNETKIYIVTKFDTAIAQS
jgi:hypothetical protein